MTRTVFKEYQSKGMNMQILSLNLRFVCVCVCVCVYGGGGGGGCWDDPMEEKKADTC